MTTFGLTPQGFVIKREQDIFDSIGAKIRARIDPNANLSPDGAWGQVIGIFASELADPWEAGQQVYDGFNPDQNTGVMQDMTAAIVGVTRLDAAQSFGTAILTGLAGTLVREGSLIEAEVNANQFETTEDATIVATVLSVGTLTFSASGLTVTRSVGNWNTDGVAVGTKVTFSNTALNNSEFEVAEVTSNTVITLTAAPVNEAVAGKATIGSVSVGILSVDAGSYAALATQIDTIKSPVAGWHTVVNPEDITPGNVAESDADLRIRRELSLQLTGAAVDGAIRANILEVEGVLECLVISNRTNDTDADGRPAKSFEAIIYPDLSDLDYEERIVREVFRLQPAGMESYGLVTYTVTDTQGVIQPVAFSFFTERDIYMIANLTVSDEYPEDGDDQVAAVLLEEGNGLNGGFDVLNWKFVAALDAIPGIVTVTILQGTGAAPTTSANIDIGARQIADFDSTRVEVNSTSV